MGWIVCIGWFFLIIAVNIAHQKKLLSYKAYKLTYASMYAAATALVVVAECICRQNLTIWWLAYDTVVVLFGSWMAIKSYRQSKRPQPSASVARDGE